MPWPIRPDPSTPTFSIAFDIHPPSSSPSWRRSLLRARSVRLWRARDGKEARPAESLQREGHQSNGGVVMLRHTQGSASPARATTHVRRSRRGSRAALLTGLAALLVGAMLAPTSALAFDHSFIGQFNTVTTVGTTVPSNGDVNPYGIVTVSSSVGALVRGDILISNFNNSENEQGTGTTIVQETPTGGLSVFAQINPATLPGPCPGGVGLTTALAILPGGYVVVGSLPTSDGSAATAQAGCLIVLNSMGHVVKTIAGAPINGPWDMTAVSNGP